MEIHRLAAEGVVPAPDPLIDGLPVHGPPGIPGEEEQELVLRFCQADLFPVPPDLHGPGVDAQSAHLQHCVPLLVAAEDHVYPGQQLHHLKGLDNIVLRPQPQPLHPVGQRALGGEEDDRYLQGPDVLHQLKAVHLRQHHVQQDEIICIPLQQIRRLGPVLGAGAAKALLGQAQADQIGNRLLVLHNQNMNQSRHPLLSHDHLIPRRHQTGNIFPSGLPQIKRDRRRPEEGRAGPSGPSLPREGRPAVTLRWCS